MSLKLPDKAISFQQLNEELAALNILGFMGVARLSRQWVVVDIKNADGEIVGAEQVLEPCEPYMLVKCGDLTTKQEASIRAVVDAHVPVVKKIIDPDAELYAAIELAGNFAELRAALLGKVKSGIVKGRS